MVLYYYHDRFAHAAVNAAGLDYTSAYIPVMLKNLGFSSCRMCPDELGRLSSGDLLIIGSDTLSDASSSALKDAVDRGAKVVSFATKGCGFLPETVPGKCSDDDYEVVGYFKFENSSEPLPVLHKYDVIKDLKAVKCGGFDISGNIFENLSESAAVRPQEGRGGVSYVKKDNLAFFTFDLPESLWRAADGRPTTVGKNGFNVGRVPDGQVLEPDYDHDIAYADSYLRELENIILAAGFPKMWALPEKDGKPCDIMLYFSGDDDAGSAENDMCAAEEMYKRGLPYHINLMPCDLEGHFVIDREQFLQLHKMGVETDIHYNFLMFPYSDEGFGIQSDMYFKAFGEHSKSPVNHCLVQHGTAADRFRMQMKFGAISDNNRMQNKLDPNDVNAFNLTGFNFGSAFPRFVVSDAAHGNTPLDFCEVYNSYYEPRIFDCLPEEYKQVEDYLDDGVRYGRPLQLFTHPHYISGKMGYPKEPALRALDHMKEYVASKGWNVIYTAPTAVGQWWHDRAACSISSVTLRSFTVNNPNDRSVCVVLPKGVTKASVNGSPASVTTKTVAGKMTSIICVSPGESKVEYLL